MRDLSEIRSAARTGGSDYRGAASVAEHRELIELIESAAAPAAIETAAREHKLHTVESFRAWRAAQEPSAAPR